VRTLLTCLLPAFCLVVLASTDASASIYGTYIGTSVEYVNVSESDTLPQLGAPTLSGASLVFNPTAFYSTASGSGDYSSNITDSQITTQIYSVGDYRLDTIRIQASGSYEFAGIGTENTTANAYVTVTVTVFGVDGTDLLQPLVLDGVTLPISPTDGMFDMSSSSSGNWTGDATIDILAALTQANNPGHATRLILTIDDTLSTLSEDGSSATLQNSNSGGLILTVTPEPATLSLMLLGGLLALRLRRRRAA
jgi:hypothetical protein